MFLKNWYYGLAATVLEYSGSLTTTNYNGIRNMSGAVPPSLAAMNYWGLGVGSKSDGAPYPSMQYVRTAITGSGGVIFGTGTTPPTMDDYCLSGDLITTFTYSAATTRTYDEDGMAITGLYTITNTGSSEITIGEIGLFAKTSNTSGSSYSCLLERTVLDTPVTIPAGDVGQVTYTIRMNYPTA